MVDINDMDELNQALRAGTITGRDKEEPTGPLTPMDFEGPEYEYTSIDYHGRHYTKAEYELRRKRWPDLFPPVRFPYFVQFHPSDIDVWRKMPE